MKFRTKFILGITAILTLSSLGWLLFHPTNGKSITTFKEQDVTLKIGETWLYTIKSQTEIRLTFKGIILTNPLPTFVFAPYHGSRGAKPSYFVGLNQELQIEDWASRPKYLLTIINYSLSKSSVTFNIRRI